MFSSHIDDAEDSDEILEVLEVGKESGVSNKVDFNLIDVQNQVESMETEMTSLVYKHSLRISSASSSYSNIKIYVDNDKLDISEESVYNVSYDSKKNINGKILKYPLNFINVF